MAISENRLTNDSIENKVNTDFISPTDTSKDTVTNKANTSINKTVSKLNKKAKSTGKNSYLTKANAVSATKTALGVFDTNVDLGCNNSFNNKTVTPDNRKMRVKPSDIICKATVDLTKKKMESIFNTSEKVSDHTGKVSDVGLSQIESATNKEVDNLVKKTTIQKGSINSDKISGKLANQLKPVGGTLKTKNKLSKIASFCNANGSSYTIGGLGTLKDYMLSAVFGLGDCLSIDHLLGVTENMLFSGIADNKDITKGIIGTFNTSGDSKTKNKVAALSSMVDNNKTPTGKDLIATKGSSNNVIKALRHSPKHSATPVSDNKDTFKVLDTIDPNWNKSHTGEPDYSVTKDNPYLNNLSNSSLKSSQPTTTTLPTDLSTPIVMDSNKAREINIVAVNSTSSNTNLLNNLR